MISELTPTSLDRLIKETNEKDYLIIDVRQHQEYRLDHIPGAVHIPLAEIQLKPFVFEDDRKLIFYCRSGSRSKVAAIIVAEAGYKEKNLFHLQGGMHAYTGEILIEMPKIELFQPDMSLKEMMEKSLDFEKGAFLFYTRAKERFAGSQLYKIMGKMAHDEISHAKSIFNQMITDIQDDFDFDLVFDACKGNILEGGKTLEEAKINILKICSENCIDILDFAVELEFSAYDLYKTVAETSRHEKSTHFFHSLAQAEKKHLQKLIESIELVE